MLGTRGAGRKAVPGAQVGRRGDSCAQQPPLMQHGKVSPAWQWLCSLWISSQRKGEWREVSWAEGHRTAGARSKGTWGRRPSQL